MFKRRNCVLTVRLYQDGITGLHQAAIDCFHNRIAYSFHFNFSRVV